MPVLSKPRHPLIDQALNDARVWCTGRVIDDRPALAHAVAVAATLGHHIPDVAPDLIAAALLHDAPEFAPPHIDLDGLLAMRYSPRVPHIIRALHAEHTALDEPDPPVIVEDLPVLLASTADKIVALASLLRRVRVHGDVDAFFAARPTLLRLLPHFRAFQQAGVGLVPASMSDDLDKLLIRLDHATASARHHRRG